MKQPKFFTLLQILPTDSFQRFRRYLQYNTPRSQQYPPVMDFLASIHPKYDAYKGDLKAEIEAILLAHDAKTMDNKRRGNFLFRLTSELEDFLAIEQLKNAPNTRRQLTYQALRHHGAGLAYNDALEDTIAELAAETNLSTEHHYAQLKVLHEAYYNTVNNKFLMEDQGLAYLQGAREQLHLFFQKLDLKYRVELKNRGNVLRAADASDSDGNKVVSAPPLVTDDAFFQLYQMIDALQNDPLNEGLFNKAVQCYRLEGAKLDAEDKGILLRYLKNAAAKILRNGASLDSLRLSFELADLGWHYNVFDALGGYTPMNFLNYVEIAVALNELDWLAKFISSSVRKIPKGQQKEVEALAMANLYFGRKNYPEALTYLRATKSKDVQIEFRIRMLYCKIFYQDESIDALESLLKSFDTYLRRSDTFQEDIVRGYLNFLKLLRLLLDVQQHDKLQKLLPITAPLYGRMWLEEQLAAK